MKSNKNKKFTLISNIAICLMLLCVFSITYTLDIKTVFSQNNTVEPYYSGNSKEPNISLMINVYWGNEYIEPMLEEFEKAGVTTTFFIGGSWANKNAELLQKIVDGGHELGNHGYFHKDHKKLSQEQNKEEIYVCHQTVKTLVNVDMNLFAPPSGAFSTTTLNVANSLGYKTIMWTRDTIDWRDHNEQLITQRATKNMKNGDLILMHPTEHTMLALPKILDYCKEHNFVVSPVSKCII